MNLTNLMNFINYSYQPLSAYLFSNLLISNPDIASPIIPVFIFQLLLAQTAGQILNIPVYFLKHVDGQGFLVISLHRVAVVIGDYPKTTDYDNSDK